MTVGITTGQHIAGLRLDPQGWPVVATAIGDLTRVGLPVPLAELTLFQKRIQGSLFGACSPSVDILRQVELYQSGKLKLPGWTTGVCAPSLEPVGSAVAW